MANLYVRSTDGSDADNGTTWALAKAKLTGAAAIDAAGDTIWVSQAHSETTAGAVSMAWAGTSAAPTRVICGNDAAEPPTVLAATAVLASTGSSTITFTGNLYVYGLQVNCSNSSNTATIAFAATDGQRQIFESCQFRLVANGASSIISSAAQSPIVWKNCDVKFAAAGQLIQVRCFAWNGGSLLSGGTSPTNLYRTTGSAGNDSELAIENIDLSNASAGINLVNNSISNVRGYFRNCKLPTSWSGVLLSGTVTLGTRLAMYNCAAGATNYALWIEDYAGTIKHETTLVRSGGASDGTTPLSWKMVSGANASYPQRALASDEIVMWNEATGSSKTVTVEILRDSATNLTDAEAWLELDYLGSSGQPLGTLITDAVADVLATPADQTTSAAAWTTTGMSNPNTQKLSVTFTPQMKGFFIARVMLAKASATIYVDPVLTVSGVTQQRQMQIPGGAFLNDLASSGGGSGISRSRVVNG